MELYNVQVGFGEKPEKPEEIQIDTACDIILSLFSEAITDRPQRDSSGLLAPIPAHNLRDFVKYEIGEEDGLLQKKIYTALRVLDLWQVKKINSQISNSFKKSGKGK